MATVSVTKAVASGSQAKGEAIASQMISEIKAQAGVLKRFLVEILHLDHAGRKAFRVAVQHHLKAMRAHVLTKENTPEHDTYAAAARSAGVRMSEAVTFSKACDSGYSPENMDDGSYHYQVAQARVFLASQGTTEGQVDEDGNVITAVGPTRRRGRKATPFIDKVKALVLKDKPSVEDMQLASELLIQMAELAKKAETKAKRAKLDETQTKEAIAIALTHAQEPATPTTVH